MKKEFRLNPPLRLDITLKQMLLSFIPKSEHKRSEIESQIASFFDKEALALFSVRTGFDLYLKSLKLPKGSKILISSVTLKDMIEIIKANDLVPVPIEINCHTLEHNFDDIKTEISNGARAIVFTHLFGVINDLEKLITYCKEHGLFIIEDCAQAFCGKQYQGHKDSDITMLSFGTIKSSTAFGGAVFLIKDKGVFEKLHAANLNYPIQSRLKFFMKLSKYLILFSIGRAPIWGMLVILCRIFNLDLDKITYSLTRVFGKGNFYSKLKFRSCVEQLALIDRQIHNFKNSPIIGIESLKTVLDQDHIDYNLLEGNPLRNTYWLLPVFDKGEVRSKLMQRGIYSSKSTTSMIYLKNNQTHSLENKFENILFIEKRENYLI